jgi:hypothetical protein
MAEFPDGFEPDEVIVRLVTLYDHDLWLSGADAQPDEIEPPSAYVAEGEDPYRPVFVVGITAEGMTVPDIFPGSGDGRAIEGALYTWDANTGDEIVVGTLVAGTPTTVATLRALNDSEIPIRGATEPPTDPPVTALPTLTWSPGELATGIAWATTVAATPSATP